MARSFDEERAFESWRESLDDAATAEAMVDFFAATTTLHGAMRGQPISRAPFLGCAVTIEVDLHSEFDNWLFANRWPDVRDRRMDEAAEAQWEALQARYA